MINYRGLSQDQLAEIPASEKSQTVHFTRTARYDLVTGELVAGSEGAWNPVSGHLAGFTPHQFPGYTATPGEIAALTVTADTPSVLNVEVNYVKNAEPVHPGGNGEHPSENGEQPGQNGDGTLPGGKGNATDQNNENTSAQHTNKKTNQLPQTGNADNLAMIGLGTATLLSMFGLAGLDKKRDK